MLSKFLHLNKKNSIPILFIGIANYITYNIKKISESKPLDKDANILICIPLE